MRRLPIGIVLVLGTAAALADGVRVPPNAAYQAECASCHVPYPPQLLSESAWKQLTAGLERHFGADASLDAQTLDTIERYLAANAGRRAAPAGREPRITETRWFRKEHRGEIPATQSPADCGACHKGANEGRYDDD